MLSGTRMNCDEKSVWLPSPMNSIVWACSTIGTFGSVHWRYCFCGPSSMKATVPKTNTTSTSAILMLRFRARSWRIRWRSCFLDSLGLRLRFAISAPVAHAWAAAGPRVHLGSHHGHAPIGWVDVAAVDSNHRADVGERGLHRDVARVHRG